MSDAAVPLIRVTGRPGPRPPLPAGHPRSRGALVAGTVLEGVAYPFPVFDRPVADDDEAA